MPVQIDQPIKALSDEEFHELDFQVMRMAFDAHNQMGRFYDEKIYRNELVRLCQHNGIETSSEVKICLTHQTFKKELFIDLLLNHGAIYELKTTSAIVSDHRIQTLDYLLMSDVKHGKIINFRPPSVEHEFVSTTLTSADRNNISMNDAFWENESETAQRLKSILLGLLADWGAFLNTSLYKEGICHFFGGKETVLRPVEIKKENVLLGTQKIPLLSEDETFCISSIKNGNRTYGAHLQRFLDCTKLETLYWINLNRSKVQLSSIRNSNHSVPNYSDQP